MQHLCRLHLDALRVSFNAAKFQDEDGNIIPKGGPPTALQQSELLAASVPPAQELQVSKARMKDCWSLIAAVAGIGTEGVPLLVAATMQHAERLNAGMPFPSAAGARLVSPSATLRQRALSLSG